MLTSFYSKTTRLYAMDTNYLSLYFIGRGCVNTANSNRYTCQTLSASKSSVLAFLSRYVEKTVNAASRGYGQDTGPVREVSARCKLRIASSVHHPIEIITASFLVDRTIVSRSMESRLEIHEGNGRSIHGIHTRCIFRKRRPTSAMLQHNAPLKTTLLNRASLPLLFHGSSHTFNSIFEITVHSRLPSEE